MRKVRYQGENRYEEFLERARTISEKISTIDGVVGILATGGLGRGFCDDYSDLDLIVYVDDDKLDEISEYIAVGVRYQGIELDTPVESFDEALAQPVPSDYWSQVMRWDRQNSQILHDTDDRLRDLLQSKLIFPEEERQQIMEKHRNEVEEKLRFELEMWDSRGDIHNMSHALRQGAEHLILWIYAKNGEFQPYIPKWIFYHLENGFVPESEHFEQIKDAYSKPIETIDQVRAVQRKLVELCSKIGLEFEYRDLENLLSRFDRKWIESSDRTRHYLRW
jgi:predicted nucleotidyltransferase